MPTETQLAAQELYANLLEEVNFRVDAINHCTSGRSGLAPPFVKEFSYLQIRMICELVALGCLLAHGDIASTKKAQSEWSAEKIMGLLESLHPYFFPQAVKITIRPGKNMFLQGKKPPPLSKADFLSLYGRTGEMLHRGSVKKLLKPSATVQINYSEITTKVQKIIDLLQEHVLVMKSGEQMFVCALKMAATGHSQVAIVQTPPGQPMDYASPTFLSDPPIPE